MSTAEQPAPVAASLDVEGRRRLNQPWRGFVAAGEVVLSVVAVVFSVPAWHHGIEHMVTPLSGGLPPLRSTIFSGNWMALAVGLVTVAAFLVLDALRETALAVGTRRRPRPEVGTFTDPEPDAESTTEPEPESTSDSAGETTSDSTDSTPDATAEPDRRETELP